MLASTVKYETLQHRIAALERESQQLQSRNAELRSELEASQERVDELFRKAERLARENLKLRERI